MPLNEQGRKLIARVAIALVVLAFVGVCGYFGYQWTTPVAPDKSVAQQWNEAIGRLGIEPVYPPEEDIAVGDVFVI